MLPIAVARSSSVSAMYDTLYSSGFVDDVMFAYNGQDLKRHLLKLTHQGSAPDRGRSLYLVYFLVMLMVDSAAAPCDEGERCDA